MSFGAGLHVMVALAFNDGEWVNSQALASSIGVNPVTVRKLIGQLTHAGLVETQPGPGGGARLARSPSRITVDDVYSALGRPPFVRGHDRDVNDTCVVSQCMPRVFDRLNHAIEDRAQSVLAKTTLRMLVDEEIPTA